MANSAGVECQAGRGWPRWLRGMGWMLWNVPIRVRVSADRRVMGNRDGVADGWNWLRGAVAWSAVEWRSIDDKRRRKVAIGQQGWSDTCNKVGRREGMSGRQGNKGKKGAGLQQVLWSWWWSWLSAKGARELLGRSERSDAK
jgi:hypothetical protein